jgi:hypothetical protein
MDDQRWKVREWKTMRKYNLEMGRKKKTYRAEEADRGEEGTG